MNDKIEISCNREFKATIRESAAERGMSMSEYLREAARRQMMDDVKIAAQEGDSNE